MMILYMYIAPHQSNTPTKLGKKITPAALEELYFPYEPSASTLFAKPFFLVHGVERVNSFIATDKALFSSNKC